MNLRPEDLDVDDIAHGLACCNRFVGQCPIPISVAQHSVFAARLCWHTKWAKQALFHDAAEAYFGDVSKWLKQTPEFAGYRKLEDQTQRMIFRTFGCEEEMSLEVEYADRLLVRYEMYRSWGKGFTVALNRPDHAYKYPELTREEIDLMRRIGPWTPWDWRESERQFLETYLSLAH
jgi:hypothetical protein